MNKIPAPSTADRARFWGRVQRTDGCWQWLGSMSRGGYGQFGYAGIRGGFAAHRVAILMSGGTLTESDVVMHTCDNRLCVNPAHLKIGTQRENVQDAISKGRATSRKSDRRVIREKMRQEDAIKYLDYLHANLCGFAKALNVGPLPLDFESWRKARYQVQAVA